jgi:hypothetical protein
MRRTIVGQVLAYAAGLAGMDLDVFNVQWQRASGGMSLMAAVLGEEAEENEAREFRSALESNLASGAFRVMVAVDVLSDELRSIIGYLALHSDVDVVALELAYARSTTTGSVWTSSGRRVHRDPSFVADDVEQHRTTGPGHPHCDRSRSERRRVLTLEVSEARSQTLLCARCCWFVCRARRRCTA